MPDKMILLLHLDSSEKNTLQQLLQDTGAFISAETGEDGLALFQNHTPSLIIVDHVLKDMSSLTFLGKLSSTLHEYCPIIVLSPECSRDDMARYYQSGISVLLTKPVNGIELSELARNLMLQYERSQEMKLQLAQCQQLLKVYSSSSHTMKNYINSVYSFIENIKYSKTDIDVMKDLLDNKILEQVLNVLKDLTELSHVVMRESSCEPQGNTKVDICKLIADKLVFFKFGKKNSKIKVQVLLPETPDVFVKANKFNISSALENIISNARDEVLIQRGAWSEKYLVVDSDKYVVSTDEPDIIINVQKEKDMVSVRISNVGRIIQDADKVRIFERGITFKPGGHGIGLYDSKKAIHDMGGTIHVEDFDNKGACFCISLPAIVN
jgi:signal transduction histidine kinase